MIADKLQGMITDAMKAGDATRVSTLKLLSSAMHNVEIDKKREKLTEAEEQEVVQFEAKKREEAIEAYEKAGRQDLADKEKAELTILKEFLPEPLTDEEIDKLITASITLVKATGLQDFGRVMGLVTKETKGRADGSVIAQKVKEKLSG